MNNEFLKKISKATSEIEKIKRNVGIGNQTLTELSGVDSLLNNTMYKSIEKNKTLMGYSSTDLLSKSLAVDSSVFNPTMSSLWNVTKMMNKNFDNDKIKDLIKPSFVDFMPYYNNDKLDTLVGLTDLTSNIYKMLNFDSYKWKDEYKDIFSSKFIRFEEYKEYKKFNDNIYKLINSSVLSNTSTIADGAFVSLNLDNKQVEKIDPEIEEIYQITNEAFEKLSDVSDYSLIIINKLLAKLSKFVNHPYTVAMVTGIFLIIANYYFSKMMGTDSENTTSNKIETIINEKVVPIKHKAIKTIKAFENIPIGAEISVIEKYRLWAKVTYINSKGVPQIGYCRIEDLSE